MAVSSKKLIVYGVVGTVMAIIGAGLIPLTDFIILKIMEKEEILVPGSLSYPVWEEVPIPIYMQFWMWNITNPDEFLRGGPAKLEQRGPYTYREYRPKVNITHHNNGTVSYMNMKVFIFDRDKSVGPDTETFLTVNSPVFAVANWLRNAPYLVHRAWELIHALSGADPLIEVSIGGLIWGYPDKYLLLAQRVFGEEWVPFTDFGFLYGYNNSDDGVWSVHTGENDIMMLNVIDLWNREKLLPYWTTDWANALNGTDGTVMHPFVKKNEEVYVFSTYVCRSGFVVFDGFRKHVGVWLYHFVAPEYIYANPEIYPPNIGFCTPDQSSCPPTGLLNASECYFKAPVYLSSPHFLYGDDSLFENVEGMHPIKDEHELQADIDPLTGVTFKGDIRAQINLKVGPYDFIRGAEQIREMYLPLVWLNESAQMTEEYGTMYRNYVQIPQYVVFSIIVLLISVGGGILVGLVIFLLWRYCRAQTDESAEERLKITAPVSSDESTREIKHNYGTNATL